MIKYLFLLLMLCSPALASLSVSDASLSVSDSDDDVDSDPWGKLLQNKSESPLRRSPTSVSNLCERDESSDSNQPVTDYKNLTRHYDLIKYAYLDQLEITIIKNFNHHYFNKKGLLCSGKVNPVSCSMTIEGKATFARIKSMTGVGKDNSLGDHFDVYQVAVGPLGCMGQATLRIPKLINDLSNQASLTFKTDQKNIHFPLKLESLIYKKPSNEQ